MMKRTNLLYILLSSLLFTLASCSVFDDLSSCPQSLYIRFYNQTPCEMGSAIDPSRLSSLKTVDVALYDANGLLRMKKNNVKLQNDIFGKYFIWNDIDCVGKYTMVCWASNDESSFVRNNYLFDSKPAEAIYSFNSENLKPTNELPLLFYGNKEIEIKDHSKDGSVVDTITSNLKNYNYTVNLTVSGLMPQYGYSYDAKIIAYDREYNFNGESTDKKIIYTEDLHKKGDDMAASFKTLLLDRTMKHPRIVIKQYGYVEKEKVVYDGDLIALIDQIQKLGVEPIDLNCVHTLNIGLNVELGPQSTYQSISVIINGWNVVFRDVNLN